MAETLDSAHMAETKDSAHMVETIGREQKAETKGREKMAPPFQGMKLRIVSKKIYAARAAASVAFYKSLTVGNIERTFTSARAAR